MNKLLNSFTALFKTFQLLEVLINNTLMILFRLLKVLRLLYIFIRIQHRKDAEVGTALKAGKKIKKSV